MVWLAESGLRAYLMGTEFGTSSLAAQHPQPAPLPSKEELLAFIGQQPGKVGTREIARAYGLKNADRALLKRLLREMADEGMIEGRHKNIGHPGTLPDVVVADITTRDGDGELIAVPAEWDEAERGAPPKIRIHVPRKTKPREIPGVGDHALLKVEAEREAHDGVAYRGRVLKILDRARHRTIGVYRALPSGGGRLIPIDKKSAGRELNIAQGATMDAQDGDLISAEVARSGRYGLPSARVVEKLGSLKSERAVSMIAIAAHGIPSVFSKDVLAEADAARPATVANREDWRDVPLVTIDPADAKDHDDAVFARADDSADNRGGFIIDVAIADVAHYVLPGSKLDREALLRGNSCYFPDRVVPMLPERISNDLCSLKPHEDRAALAVRMVIGADGRKKSHRFHRILMRSAAKLHYAQAQAAIDGQPDDTTRPLLEEVLKPLYAAYAALKIARAERDPLDLELPERKILLKDDGMVDRVIVPERLDAHRLIEEFMILANVAAAETLERMRTPLIYRTHDEPTPEKIEGLREFLQSLEMGLPKGGTLHTAQFNRILERVRESDNRDLVNQVVLRSQSQAEYSADNYGHFGLNLRKYAHFTSPIRRYADLIVHRALIRALSFGDGALPGSVDTAQLVEVAAQISATERRAMAAERETVDRLIAYFLADRVGATFEGHIAGVTRAGLFVKLDGTGADGFIPARTIGDEYFRYDEAHHSLQGERSGMTYRLGDRATVKLVEAAPVAGALRFEILSDGRIEKGHRPGRVRTRRDGGRKPKPAPGRRHRR
jgi:ribonuclease R